MPIHTRPTIGLTYSIFMAEPTGTHHGYIGLEIETAANMERVGAGNLRRGVREAMPILAWGTPTQPYSCSLAPNTTNLYR